MSLEAPLWVTVEIELLDGPAARERRFRLSHRLELPPALAFEQGLPLSGEGRGRVTFRLPDGTWIQADALLHHDPEHPEQGSEARLVELTTAAREAIETYITDFQRG